jgi:hypothetical protein
LLESFILIVQEVEKNVHALELVQCFVLIVQEVEKSVLALELVESFVLIVQEVEKSVVGTRLAVLNLETRDENLLNVVLFLCVRKNLHL